MPLFESISMKTLYDLLSARADDDAETLKKAFRIAVKAIHPDLRALCWVRPARRARSG